MLETPDWGTLAPEDLPSTRRLQTLGLGVAVRHFNDRAVPGLGGMWFPMPLLWSVLAVALAEKLHRSALPIGNAIEAAAMLRAFNHRNVEHADSRVRGRRKLAGAVDSSLANLSRRGAYVVQPIRMAMVQPLSALGFVRGNRYGSFRLHDAGRRMLNLPTVRDWFYDVERWASEKGGTTVFDMLSPVVQVPYDIRKLIKARIIEGDDADDTDAARRRSLAALMEGGNDLGPEALAKVDIPKGLCATHWKELRAGCALVNLRDDALSVLRAIESELLRRRKNNEPTRITVQDAWNVAEVKEAIETMKGTIDVQLERIAAAGEPTSTYFADFCCRASEDRLIRFIASRDGNVIRLKDEHLEPGPVAGELREAERQEQGVHPSDERKRFAPQLYRLWNLHCLMEELNGRPNPYIKQGEDA